MFDSTEINFPSSITIRQKKHSETFASIKCSMCKGTNIELMFHPGVSWWGASICGGYRDCGKADYKRAHLNYTCSRCNYTWIEYK